MIYQISIKLDPQISLALIGEKELKMRTDIGFGVSIEVQRYEDTPKEITGLVIYNDLNKLRVNL